MAVTSYMACPKCGAQARIRGGDAHCTRTKEVVDEAIKIHMIKLPKKEAQKRAGKPCGKVTKGVAVATVPPQVAAPERIGKELQKKKK